jgi:hypothetical protein
LDEIYTVIRPRIDSNEWIRVSPVSFRPRFRQAVLLEKAQVVRTLLLVVIFARIRKILLRLLLLRLLEEDSSARKVIGGRSARKDHIIDQLNRLKLAIIEDIGYDNLELEQL